MHLKYYQSFVLFALSWINLRVQAGAIQRRDPDSNLALEVARSSLLHTCTSSEYGGLALWAPETIEASESEKGRYVTKGLLRFQDVVSDENASGDDFAYSSRMAVLAAWVKFNSEKLQSMFQVEPGPTPWCLKDATRLVLTGAKSGTFNRMPINGTDWERTGQALVDLVDDAKAVRSVGGGLARWPWFVGHAMSEIWAQQFVDGGNACNEGYGCLEITANFFASLAGSEIGQAGLRGSTNWMTKPIMGKADKMPVVMLTGEPAGAWAVLGLKSDNVTQPDLYEIWNHKTGKKEDYQWNDSTHVPVRSGALG